MAKTTEDLLPWYRQLWFWLVIGPLIFIVVLCAITVSMAFHYSDDIVTDNYYKEGVAINQTLHQDERALALGLSATIKFDSLTNEVIVSLNNINSAPEQLILFMDHPVKKTKDQYFLLHKIGAGIYRAEISAPLEFSWYLALVPAAEASQRKQAEWMLSGNIDFSKASETFLQPRVK